MRFSLTDKLPCIAQILFVSDYTVSPSLLPFSSSCETASIDKERQAWPSCSTSESKHFLASRDLHSTLRAFREKRYAVRVTISMKSSLRKSFSIRSFFPRENFKTKRIGHVETRSIGESVTWNGESRFRLILCFAFAFSRDRGEKENEKKFSETLHVVPVHLKQQTYTYVRDLGSEYGA